MKPYELQQKPRLPKHRKHIYRLVGGWTNLIETYESNWIFSSSRGENKHYLKPSPSIWLPFTDVDEIHSPVISKIAMEHLPVKNESSYSEESQGLKCQDTPQKSS